MQPIFNSLGSNYNTAFIQLSRSLLFKACDQTSLAKLQLALNQYYPGQVTLFYKGRQAITHALENLGIGSGDQVLTQAFTCFAVEQGITNSGASPVFADTTKDSLNLSVNTLQVALKTAPAAKAVLVQHTLGQPADIQSIRQFCTKHKLFLIEDLAHSFAAKDKIGVPLGKYADAIILSFGRDKALDAISGGASILKTKPALTSQPPPTSLVKKDLIYPSLASLIKNTSSSIPGKVVHRLLSFTPLMSSPIHSPNIKYNSLPPQLAQLTLFQLKNIPLHQKHRLSIANIYHKNIQSSSSTTHLPTINQPLLRYPLLVDNRQPLIRHLKSHNFYLADTWYRHPVETGRLSVKSSYTLGSCPHAEHLSQHIINLPTHINISSHQAQQLAQLINQFYE